ncbi:MAG: M15 family metallopeptidase [Pseudomonadota bacterium]
MTVYRLNMFAPLVAFLCLLGAGCITASAPPAPDPSQQGAALPDGFVYLSDIDDTIVQDMRYFGADNFVGRRIKGYRAPRCILSKKAAKALSAAQRVFLAEGRTLIVFDCYRPQQAVDDFAAWAKTDEQAQKRAFYPDVPKDALFEQGYIAARSGHSRGGAVDLAFVELAQSAERTAAAPDDVDCRAPGAHLQYTPYDDFGAGYDCFDPQSHTDDARIVGEARRNRQRLKDVLEAHGFVNYPLEWWHYSLADEAFPDTYFSFPVE